MSPSLEKILSEIEQLTLEEQLAVMGAFGRTCEETYYPSATKTQVERFEGYGSLSTIG
jgi:hypothetical protein